MATMLLNSNVIVVVACILFLFYFFFSLFYFKTNNHTFMFLSNIQLTRMNDYAWQTVDARTIMVHLSAKDLSFC